MARPLVLTAAQIAWVERALAARIPARRIAASLGVSESTIRKVGKGLAKPREEAAPALTDPAQLVAWQDANGIQAPPSGFHPAKRGS